MPYIGQPLNAGNLSVQTGTGDGSDTTPIAALNYSVGSSESLAIYLDGVKQAVSTYTASGTTLTFTTAPPNGVGIEVVFLALPISLPTPGDNTVDETKLKDALIADFTEVVVTASDSILLGDATDSGNTKRDTVQGILDLVVTDVKFSAYKGSETVDVTGDGTSYAVPFDTEVFDTGADYASNTFTAPSTGKYLLIVAVSFEEMVDTTFVSGTLNIITSNRTYSSYFGPQRNVVNDLGQHQLVVIADMDASDTASITTVIAGGTKVLDVYGTTAPLTYFMGALLA